MSQNWEMLISFKVHGKGKELFGDGLAFWYARDRMLQGPVFGNNDFFSGMAIILDTYSNHNGPHNVSFFISIYELIHVSDFFLIALLSDCFFVSNIFFCVWIIYLSVNFLSIENSKFCLC